MAQASQETYQWSRLEGESEDAYNGFRFYLHMEKPRGLLPAYRLYTNRPQAAQANGTWNGWCSKFSWVERAKAYDLHLENARFQQVTATEKQLAINWAERKQANRHKAATLAELMMERGGVLLQSADQVSADGKTIVKANPRTLVAGGKLVAQGVEILEQIGGIPEKHNLDNGSRDRLDELIELARAGAAGLKA